MGYQVRKGKGYDMIRQYVLGSILGGAFSLVLHDGGITLSTWHFWAAHALLFGLMFNVALD